MHLLVVLGLHVYHIQVFFVLRPQLLIGSLQAFDVPLGLALLVVELFLQSGGFRLGGLASLQLLV